MTVADGLLTISPYIYYKPLPLWIFYTASKMRMRITATKM